MFDGKLYHGPDGQRKGFRPDVRCHRGRSTTPAARPDPSHARMHTPADPRGLTAENPLPPAVPVPDNTAPDVRRGPVRTRAFHGDPETRSFAILPVLRFSDFSIRAIRRPPAQRGARCPVCGSLERHRLSLKYMVERTDLFDGRPKRMLHVAPERQLSKIFQAQKYIDYLSVDLRMPAAMAKMDITELLLPDDAFDVIYCSHVLEHVVDDRKAMRELHRVIKPDGWAILQVPISGEVTLEDPSITTSEERQRRLLSGGPCTPVRNGLPGPAGRGRFPGHGGRIRAKPG